ncbi:MAG: hypothetical protein WEB90_05860 [Gemmatimonadota bacterium]
MSGRPEAGSVSTSGRPSEGAAHTVGEGVRYHGARVLLLVALAAFLTVMFPPTRAVNLRVPPEGSIAPQDVTAEVPFSIPKTPIELERDRRLAMAALPPTFE